ncbi:class I SAM-dependent methyltransferase [Thalassospira sp.]|uniref:class I SAM-dependent methyltransferase n=1 Tax=Thalassospira sp. TaxID=1912094 RepID=UPI0032EA98D2
MSSQLPSNWITQHCPAPTKGRNRALDLACGKGRNSFWLAKQGWSVTGLDRDLSQTNMADHPDITWQEADLETGSWPLGSQSFDLVIVANYLHRPLFPYLRDAVRSGGTLIYETFMVGNEAYGRPRSPDFLLYPDELRQAFAGWDICAFKQGPIHPDGSTRPTAVKQSIAAKKPSQ